MVVKRCNPPFVSRIDTDRAPRNATGGGVGLSPPNPAGRIATSSATVALK
jgi:hypothetical protein